MHLLGLSEDGAFVLLTGPESGTVRLPVDDRLRAAVLGDSARLQRIEAKTESALSPREIQARLRAGASADAVAAAAGVPVDRIRRFAGPVLAERQHVVEAARVAPPGPAGGGVPPLGEFTDGYLERLGVEPDSVAWDAWRLEDGSWAVELAYKLGGRDWAARWRYDAVSQHVAVADAAAAAIVAGEEMPATAEGRSTGLSLVPEPVRDRNPDEAVVLPEEPLPAVSGEPMAEPAPAPVPSRAQRRRGPTDRQAEADGVAPGKRATVPSWDEILFGTKPPES
jgi:hypothetical protein